MHPARTDYKNLQSPKIIQLTGYGDTVQPLLKLTEMEKSFGLLLVKTICIVLLELALNV